jgi:hypothetical protein
MKRYEAIERVNWKNTRTGATASIYGALPYTSAGDAKNWVKVTNGWTIRDNVEGRVGGYNACPAGSSKEHAEAVATNFNEVYELRVAAYEKSLRA